MDKDPLESILSSLSRSPEGHTSFPGLRTPGLNSATLSGGCSPSPAPGSAPLCPPRGFSLTHTARPAAFCVLDLDGDHVLPTEEGRREWKVGRKGGLQGFVVPLGAGTLPVAGGDLCERWGFLLWSPSVPAGPECYENTGGGSFLQCVYM